MRRGFHRNYQEKVEETSSLRGRIAFAPSVRQMSWTKGRMACEFTELSYNTVPNRILKTTLRNLMHTRGLERDRKEEIGGILRHLHEVDPIRISGKVFRRIQYHQNLRFYRFLMNICELVHESLIPTQQAGESAFRDFIRDERKMAYVYERFVYNFFKHETGWDVGKTTFPWQQVETDDETALSVLPTMNTDVELSRGTDLLILDCKYYRQAFTTNWNIERFKTPNLYQLYAYVMNRALKDPELSVSGMLLYPETKKSFCHRFELQGHSMCIASINLDQPWRNIDRELKALIDPSSPEPPNKISETT